LLSTIFYFPLFNLLFGLCWFFFGDFERNADETRPRCERKARKDKKTPLRIKIIPIGLFLLLPGALGGGAAFSLLLVLLVVMLIPDARQ
jgi:hypothetical protein